MVPTEGLVFVPEGDDTVQLARVDYIPADTIEEWRKKGMTGEPSPQWKWVFTSQKINAENSTPFECFVYTGTTYGDARANLTRLYNNLLPGIEPAARKKYDTDNLIGQWFNTRWIYIEGKNGKKKLDYVFLIPYVAPAAAPAPVPAPAPPVAAAPKPAPAKPATAAPAAVPGPIAATANANGDPFASE
jgi:hypothetical protein